MYIYIYIMKFFIGWKVQVYGEHLKNQKVLFHFEWERNTKVFRIVLWCDKNTFTLTFMSRVDNQKYIKVSQLNRK